MDPFFLAETGRSVPGAGWAARARASFDSYTVYNCILSEYE